MMPSTGASRTSTERSGIAITTEEDRRKAGARRDATTGETGRGGLVLYKKVEGVARVSRFKERPDDPPDGNDVGDERPAHRFGG